MFYTRPTHSSHQVAPEEAELRLLIATFQCLHQMRRMQIATGLADYQVVSHLFSNFFNSLIPLTSLTP